MLVYHIPALPKPTSIRDFIRLHCGVSQSLWRRIQREGRILCNNQTPPPGYWLQEGDILVLSWPKHPAPIVAPLPLDIAYEDDVLLVVNKPAGLLAHPHAGPPEATLADAVLTYYQTNGWDYEYHPVHRLDRNTSGLVLIAKRPDIQHFFQKDSLLHLKRSYLGLCHGDWTNHYGCIQAPIARKPGSLIERCIAEDGQHALTHFHCCRHTTNVSLLRFNLETGRTHQIRVHCAHVGHPLLGDDLYGGLQAQIQRQALHAYTLRFYHPLSKKLICVRSSLPSDMKNLLQKQNII
ncbi:RluA family pseudouridine synthase [Anaeroarcus burkinensis]|uniref:RluA family pseudouridine synthase n=1 Tax=Anaeroarcus burkinensis TaxID=82376 RepID=UPI0004172FFB|nr:RluA family pseudouridine synthase [Anaeroarcus burkinensis]